MEVGFEFFLILFFVAGLYAAVGHGGASGYLALMAIYGFAPEVMKPSALVLNLFVAGVSFVQYYRNGHFNFRLLLVFIITSVPMAFVGGMMIVDPIWYKRILGILLIFAVLRLSGIFGNKEEKREVQWLPALLLGAGIGFFSGLIGIGGGIILSPIIMLLGWGNVKETAAVSAAFIWINSFSGLLGLGISGNFETVNLVPYVSVALIGGFLGAYFGSFKWDLKLLKWCLSFVLMMASVKLILI
ncbi:sulfite exporter TauE/SafE family protein [Marinoscillum sp. MHG1-6]|uniref:sulfite exporter TauE/SafE family protein n=1 Tax=Marinoscillum sp. MHG1-6 TaxID=2959627 RepID=UPI00215874AC|nr:sulfite exporter TauE/SafE family protein [Marinoscillum sp. MHG1-6]